MNLKAPAASIPEDKKNHFGHRHKTLASIGQALNQNSLNNSVATSLEYDLNESMITAKNDYQAHEASRIFSQRKTNRTAMTSYDNYGDITGRQNRKYAALSKVKMEYVKKIQEQSKLKK